MNERDDMQLKRDLDALPREIQPPADLWPAVRGRIGARRSVETSKRRNVQLIRIAALLAVLAVSAGALMLNRQHARTWRLMGVDASEVMHAGDSLATGSRRRLLMVGTIGSITADPATNLRIVKASATEQRMALGRGTIRAEISAPPRLFIVETPSGTAVDLGCAYTLTVDSTGSSTLVVTAGWVSFENGDTRSLIPAGMTAVTQRGRRPGTPVMDDASPELRDAVAIFDAAPSDSALGPVLRVARTRDAVTLWHLVGRTGGQVRGRIVTKLIAMVPLPSGVERTDIERAEPLAMEIYWTTLPGTLPIVPSWQQALWKLWLKVGG